ncbi:hypothetical protein [Serratia bockelmannii]|uniref:hypothetical protein n=1 Tax=Serratia bockelmannii TaxID=2703793 RepID=UPI00384B4E55
MDDGLKESVTLALKERLSNPLWGYILLSWIGFNWQNIAKLFMSKKTVEERNKILMETISNALSLVKDIRESYNQELDYGVTTNISRHKEMDLLINELSSTLKIINKNVYMNNSKKNKNIINNIKNRAVISGTTAG